MSAKFDPAELLQVLVEIARSGSRSHITSEYRRCASSSAGSNVTTPCPSHGQTQGTASPSSAPSSAGHIEDSWWTAQDQDPNWINQWDHDDENTDPKSWK